MPVEYGSLPFPEAIEYLRGKSAVDTATWTDIWESEHARAFTVAGATKDNVLTDLHAAITKAIEKGTTLEEFRKDFDAAVARTGWPYKGGRNWRTRVIYETNMRTAYQAGRYKQLQEIKSRRPYWQYDHSDFVTHPRPEHEAWDGLVLDADDPWWDTHYPPNGWGCRCSVRALSKRDLARLGKQTPDNAPAIVWEEKAVGVQGPNPRTVRVPEGIDPGWGYNVGKVPPTGEMPPPVVVKPRKEVWDPSIRTGWKEAGRPEHVPLARLPRPPMTAAQSKEEAERMLVALFDGQPSRTYQTAGMDITINARRLAQHLEENDLPRTQYYPLIDDVLNNPYEVWRNFETNRSTQKERIVARFVKAYEVRKQRYVMVVVDASQSVATEITFFVSKELRYINIERMGVLVLGSDENET